MIKRVRKCLKEIEIMMVKLKSSLATVKQQKRFSKEFVKGGNKKIMRNTIFRKGSENRYQQLRKIYFLEEKSQRFGKKTIIKLWLEKPYCESQKDKKKITHRFQNLFSCCHTKSMEKNCYIPLPLPQMLCSLTQEKAG